jgi:glycosidase
MGPNVRELLTELYGGIAGQAAMTRLQAVLDRYRADLVVPAGQRGALSQRDAMLITYGDQVREPNVPPLQTLAACCDQHLIGVVSGVHLLPFYPSSSDDGFAVIDYQQVDPALGNWAAVTRIGQNFRLVFDGVINHISAESEWFTAFLRDDRKYREYFIAVEDDPDLSQVVRPRALPLLIEVNTPSGRKKVWTTFSTDQIDLNYHNPDVLLDIIDTLLFYVTQGAEFIRLDAIAYLWKEIGTPCIHLPQTHRVIQLIRAVLDEVAPHVTLITETNVPHEDNISYFGDGHNEAQLVYNFALPPLTLHALHTGNARALTKWAASLSLPSDDVTFFNFLASHDGIGLNPARGVLSDSEIEALVDRAIACGGLVSYKQNPDGTHSPYELNINYFDALSNPNNSEPIELQLDRFVAAHAIMLSIGGVPGIYFHSLFGSRGWPEGVQLTGRNRTINRQKIDRATLERDLNDPTSLPHLVFSRLKHLLQVRSASAAFHPNSTQRVLQFDAAIFAVLRASVDDRVLCLHNVSSQPQIIRLDRDWQTAIDLIAARRIACDADGAVMLTPYQILWLTGNDHDR